MKKVVGIVLLAFLAIPFLGTYGWLRLQRNTIRRQVKEMIITGMDEETLTLFKFTESELETDVRWVHHQEFRYKDQMFDVVKRQEIDGLHYLWCWPDEKESQISNQLDALVAYALGNNPQQRERTNRLSNFLTNLFYTSPKPLVALLYPEKLLPDTSGHFRYISLLLSPPVPPPEMS